MWIHVNRLAWRGRTVHVPCGGCLKMTSRVFFFLASDLVTVKVVSYDSCQCSCLSSGSKYACTFREIPMSTEECVSNPRTKCSQPALRIICAGQRFACMRARACCGSACRAGSTRALQSPCPQIGSLILWQCTVGSQKEAVKEFSFFSSYHKPL